MYWILQFFGRFHPLFVHLPIGILFLAFLFECLSNFKRYASLRVAVAPALLIGAFFAVASVISGLFLSQEGGYEDSVVDLHRNLGIATAIFTIVLYLFQAKPIQYFSRYAERNSIRIISFLVLITLLSITGHFGGTLTHGEEYLFEYISSTEEAKDPSEKLKAIHNVDSAVLYSEIIQPILDSRCYSCHSSRKQKGELRLDGLAFIMQGGDNGKVIEPGIADSSTLYKRLMLPLEDEDHMPPNEKSQPSSAEIALVKAWIEEGADFEKRVDKYTESSKIKTYFQLLVAQSQTEKLIPTEEVPAADPNVVTQLRAKGVIVLPVGSETNYLTVNFVNTKLVSEEDLKLLLSLKSQLVWLDLKATSISDEGLREISQLTALRKLNLDYTSITDKGIEYIGSLSELTSLNLVGTKITDEGLIRLATLKKLKNIFLYKTGVTANGFANFTSASPSVNIDTGGYQLPKIVGDSAVETHGPS